jgi:ABC-type nickel/cobalt efflux system permease component RcnA/ABC-type uncharacterized transport system substrate-binding protein
VLVFDQTGALAAIRHSWTFDRDFSAWSIQGLDTNNDGVVSTPEMQELADEDMKGLGEYDYYTYAGEGDYDLTFAKGSDAVLTYENEQTTLDFAIAATPPYHIKKRFELAINDPEYYVAITFSGPEAITLENAPPGCRASLDPPKEMDQTLSDELYALGPDVMTLPPALAQAMKGVQGAIIVTCPEGTGTAMALPATTALDAANLIGNAKPVPFNGPPAEPGLPMARTGVLGWIADMQKEFYAAMSETLGKLKNDNTAFWLLGTLSFLYGVFHAAGPGHGKVVISSYLLANERQLRRGLLLSFVSAMMQSLVAVAFVLAAVTVLHLTSMAMSTIANWIGIASYGLVAMLGAWLVVRHVFFGHRHNHGHTHPVDHRQDYRGKDAEPGHEHLHHAHEHAHEIEDEDDGHRHIVRPQDLRGGIREQLAVLLGVGLRPCSGALVVLVFALSQGVVLAGIAAVFLMGLGTAITVGILATLAVTAKNSVLRFASPEGGGTAGVVVWWLELAGAAAVLGFGVLLLLASF